MLAIGKDHVFGQEDEPVHDGHVEAMVLVGLRASI